MIALASATPSGTPDSAGSPSDNMRDKRLLTSSRSRAAAMTMDPGCGYRIRMTSCDLRQVQVERREIYAAHIRVRCVRFEPIRTRTNDAAIDDTPLQFEIAGLGC